VLISAQSTRTVWRTGEADTGNRAGEIGPFFTIIFDETKEGLLGKKAIQAMPAAAILEIVASRRCARPRPTVIADTYRMKLITESEKCGVS